MVCTSAFCQGHALLRGCLWKEDSQLWGTANVLTPGLSAALLQSLRNLKIKRLLKLGWGWRYIRSNTKIAKSLISNLPRKWIQNEKAYCILRNETYSKPMKTENTVCRFWNYFKVLEGVLTFLSSQCISYTWRNIETFVRTGQMRVWNKYNFSHRLFRDLLSRVWLPTTG